MGLLDLSMKSTQTSSKVFKQVRQHDGKEKTSFQVCCPWTHVVLKFAVPQRRAWHFFCKGRTSLLGDTTQWFLFFFRQLTDCNGRKKVCQTNLVPEFGSRMSRLWAARRAFETMDRSRLSRRALLARARPTHQTVDCLTVAEQIRRDVTVEEMWSFAKEFDYVEAVLEEPLTNNRSHTEFDDVEMQELPKRRPDSRGSR